ncbi:MAG: right-handed parallel beta-helix repeat-containing protein [Pseudomonadota bacterium]
MDTTLNRRRRVLALVISLLISSVTLAVEIGPSDDLEAAVAALTPGDELVLQGGTYAFNENVTLSANGTVAQPILVRAKAGETPVITQATTNHNVVEINLSSYLTIRGITFTGGSHGIRLMNSDYVTIEDCEIYETGDVAISANAGGTYEGLVIRRNHIHHTNGTGEGMYLGCNNDNCRVANSIVESNYIHHTNRSSVSQGDGIELKEGSYGNVIRNNVIHDTGYPGIISYSTVGNGAQNVIEGNVVWNSSDNTMQVAADAIIRNNIILGNVAFQSHQSGRPSNIEFVHNTIVNTGSGVAVRNVVGPVLIANNAIYTQGTAIRLISGSINQVTVAGNVGAGGMSGGSGGYTSGNGLAADTVGGNYNGAPPLDVFPSTGSALINGGDTTYVVSTDFNGTPRAGSADAGAYRFDSDGNPGWQITADFKDATATIAPMPPENLETD